MEKNLEIRKLADVVVWADNQIEEMRMDLAPSLSEEEFKLVKDVKDFETVKKVVLESIDRHAVYTSALNKDIADKAAKINLLEKEIAGRKEGYYALKEQLDNMTASKEGWRASVQELVETCKSKNEEIEKLKKERDKQMARVSDLRMELDCVKASKEKHEEAAHDKLVKDLRDNINYWRSKCLARNTEIETLKTQVTNLEKELEEKNKYKEYWESQYNYALKCHEEDVDEICRLKDENSYLKKECKDKNDIIKKAYDRYVDEACKGREEIMNECYEKLTKDNTGYTGFKLYVKNTLTEAKGDKKEANEIITDTIKIVYAEWSKEQKEKEEAKKELNEAFDIPCGEDSIE